MLLHLIARNAKFALPKTTVLAPPCLAHRVTSCQLQSHIHTSAPTHAGRKQVLENRFIRQQSERRQLLSLLHPESNRKHRENSSSPDSQKDASKSFLHRLQDAPPPALYLGFAGLFPFVGPALFCLGSLSYSPFLAFTQVTYGATILSFLGGIHWGYSIDNKDSPPSWKNLGYSVIPPLIAWCGLLLTAEFGTLLLMSGFAIAWRRDIKIKTTPPWFRALRVCLSVGAIVSLGLTYTMGLLYPPPDTSTTYNWVKLMKIIKIILED